jgi:hypothetical protein
MDFLVHLKRIKKYKLDRKQYYDIKLHKNCFFYHKKIDLRMHVIYKHTNKINGKVYIGQTIINKKQTSLEATMRRWNVHVKNSLINDENKQYSFYKAIREFGLENFEHEIIEDNIPNLEETNEEEMYWIELYDCIVPNGYNMNKGGNGNLGYLHTFEERQKMKHEMSIKQRQNISKINTNNSYAAKPVICYDKCGNRLMIYSSAYEASQILGICHTSICGCLQKSTRKFAGGFIWRRIDDPLEQDFFDKLVYNKKAFHRKAVLQYDKLGFFIQRFESIADAARATNLCTSTIRACCNGILKTSGGFIWKFDF